MKLNNINKGIKKMQGYRTEEDISSNVQKKNYQRTNFTHIYVTLDFENLKKGEPMYAMNLPVAGEHLPVASFSCVGQ